MELELGDHKYVIGTMKSRQQRNVLRRVVPLIVASQPLLSQIARAIGSQPAQAAVTEEESAMQSMEMLFSSAGPFADALSAMPDEQFDYIFDTCLAVVKRRVPGGLQDIIIASGDLRYDDITLPQQLQLIFAVMKENFSDFFPALPGQSNTEGMAGAPSS